MKLKIIIIIAILPGMPDASFPLPLSPYEVIGPYYDLLAASYRRTLAGPLATLVGAASRGLLEIGAGTGLVTEPLARTVSGPVYAAEPSPVMRTALVARLVADDDLAAKVTVLPDDALGVEVPEPVDAIVMLSVLYAFPASDRAALWRRCAKLLAPGGLLVLDPPDPDHVGEFGDREMAGARLGRHRFEGSYRGAVVDADTMRLTMTYRTYDGAGLLREDQVTSLAHPVSLPALDAELTKAGFASEAAPEGLLAWRRPAA